MRTNSSTPRRITLFLFAVLTTLSATPSAHAFNDAAELSRWMSRYYQQPQPERLREAVTQFIADPAQLANPERLDAPVHFFGVIAHVNAGAKRDLAALAAAKNPPAAMNFIDRILAHPGKLKIDAVRDPNDLDVLWAHYSVTGELNAARQVLAALDFSESTVDLNRPIWRAIRVTDRPEAVRLVRGAAAWSLAQHARDDHPVRNLVEQELRTSSDPARQQRLREILDGKVSLR